jgi:hypothetical protein
MRSKGWPGGALLLVCVVSGLASGAHAATCGGSRAAPVTVELAPPVLLQDETLGMAELARLQSVHIMTSAASRAVFGLTQASRDARVTIDTTVSAAGVGRYCSVLERVRVVWMPRLSVHIAREATADTCFRDYVRAHEGRHVEVERSFARGEVDYVRSRLEEFVAAVPGRTFGRGGSQEAWRQELLEQIKAELRQVSAEIVPERQARHKAEVDDPDHGAATRICDGFANRLIETYRQQVAAAAN